MTICFFYSSYKKELEETYAVDLVSSPKDFWQKLGDQKPEYRGIILDILLPYGDMDPDKVEGGLNTGIVLIEMIKASPYRNIPLVIFTIRDNSDIDDIGSKYGLEVLRKGTVRMVDFISTITKEFGK